MRPASCAAFPAGSRGHAPRPISAQSPAEGAGLAVNLRMPDPHDDIRGRAEGRRIAAAEGLAVARAVPYPPAELHQRVSGVVGTVAANGGGQGWPAGSWGGTAIRSRSGLAPSFAGRDGSARCSWRLR